eukprot:TRINITY_DN3316_c0_g2_i2.p1 TRINITY_DN3316_c0_g2~~TRINITY_DN3316_c0_g2_i2.p1  ORF type:complete len:283 (-),score=50.29 TRINITY_DN3316_c0_g2_i2:177-1025(-)
MLETKSKNMSIYVQCIDSSMSVWSVSLMVYDNRNQVVTASLVTKSETTPKDRIFFKLIENCYGLSGIGICKSSTRVYESNISDYTRHRGALLHPVLLIETNLGVVEAHLPEFWSVSNCPHRLPEMEALLQLMNVFKLCDPSVPEKTDYMPIAYRIRRTRSFSERRRGRFLMELTSYLDARSEIFMAQALYQGVWSRKLVLKSQDEALFQRAMEEYKIATALSRLNTIIQSEANGHASDMPGVFPLFDMPRRTVNVQPEQTYSVYQQEADGGSEETEIMTANS